MPDIIAAFADPRVLVVFTIVWALCFFVIVRFVWKTFAPFPRSQFSFYITDIYALNLTLIPPYLLLRWVETDELLPRETEHVVFLHLLALLILSELLGIFVARLHSIPANGERMPQRLGQVGWILGGAFMGVVFLCLSATLTAFVLLALMAWPCVLLLLVFIFLLRGARWIVSWL